MKSTSSPTSDTKWRIAQQSNGFFSARRTARNLTRWTVLRPTRKTVRAGITCWRIFVVWLSRSLAGLRPRKTLTVTMMTMMMLLLMLTSGWTLASPAVHAASCLAVAASVLAPAPLACLSAASSAGRDPYSNLYLETAHITHHTDWVNILRPTRHKIGHFGNVLPSQSLGILLKKLNLTQHKQTTQEQNSLS